jgi:uncharacterized protein (TIGR02996 family)
MTDREMLLRAIQENPDEDTPRLAYADVLEEQGNEQRNQYFLDWAELIRVQIEYATVERYSDRWFELAQRQVTLFTKRKNDWSPLWGSRLGCAAYRRGFWECHHFTPGREKLHKSFDQAVAGNPLRGIRFNTLGEAGKPAVSATARHPGLARVETLDLVKSRRSLVRKFLSVVTPRMPKLRALGLTSFALTAAEASELLMELSLPNLTALDLSHNMLFGASSMPHYRPESLLHSPALRKVRWLDLFHSWTTAEAVYALAHGPVLKELRYLNLGSQRSRDNSTLGQDIAEAIASGPSVRALEVLSLAGQWIGTHGLAALLRSPVLANVRELDLEGNNIGDEGVIALATCPHLRALRKLNLSRNEVGNAGVEAILASPHLERLRILTLGYLGPGIDPLAESWIQARKRFLEKAPTIPDGFSASEFFDPIP